MRVMPLDIIQKQFSPARKGGYEPEEVRAFLDDVRESMEELIKENQRLRDELARREREIEELRAVESDVHKTLDLARRLKEDLDRGARREADVIVGEARLEAERILMAAAEERRELQAEIVRLRSSRTRLLSDLQAVVDSWQRILADMQRGAPSAAR